MNFCLIDGLKQSSVYIADDLLKAIAFSFLTLSSLYSLMILTSNLAYFAMFLRQTGGTCSLTCFDLS